MKTFKQGDKVKVISLDDMPHSESVNWAVSERLQLGKIYTVSDFEEDATKNVVKLGNGLHYFHDAERFELVDLTGELVGVLQELLNSSYVTIRSDELKIKSQSAINKALNI